MAEARKESLSLTMEEEVEMEEEMEEGKTQFVVTSGRLLSPWRSDPHLFPSLKKMKRRKMQQRRKLQNCEAEDDGNNSHERTELFGAAQAMTSQPGSMMRKPGQMGRQKRSRKKEAQIAKPAESPNPHDE